MTFDYYRILNVGRHASVDEIHRAYRTLALRFHPDRNPDSPTAELMTRVNQAYACLGDPERRRAYDSAAAFQEPGELQEAALDAARELLVRAARGWRQTESAGHVILGKDRRRIAVRFAGVLGPAELNQWARAAGNLFASGLANAAVGLAYRIPDPGECERTLRRFVAPVTAVDLVQSRAYGPALPDSARDLFAAFLLD